MLTDEIKNKIDSLQEMSRVGGITNPMDFVEQITYLMYIHDLNEMDTKKAKKSFLRGLPHTSVFAGHEQYKWSAFHELPDTKMYDLMQNEIFPFVKSLRGSGESFFSQYMSDAIFKIPTPQLLSQIVDALDDIYMEMSKDSETNDRGEVYEYLLTKLTSAGLNGQFCTPRHIIRMMVELLAPKPSDIICDPISGTSGFLVFASEYLKEKYPDEIFYNREKKDHYYNTMFFGYDADRTMVRISAMNMISRGFENPNILCRDSLSNQNPDNGKYSVILANPCFKGTVDSDTVSADLFKMCKTTKTELLFLALFLRMMRVGGRCACIVSDGVLFGSTNAHKTIRKAIVDGNRLEAVISMPSGVFKPYSSVPASILIFTKTRTGGTDKVWFYDMHADGYSLDNKRNAIPSNDIPDVIARFHNLVEETGRSRTEQSFFVPKSEIAANDYNLSIDKYKKPVYEVIEHRSTAEIVTSLHELQLQVSANLEKITSLLEL